MARAESPAKILVAHGDDDRRASLVEALESMGHVVIAAVGSGRMLIADALRLDPDLIVTSVGLPDIDGIEALLEATRHVPRPAVIVTTEERLSTVEEALEDHVMAYLVEPVGCRELRPSIYLARRRFVQFEALRKKVRELEAALDARKTIERAKGLLMKQHDLDEETAHRRLQKLASEHRKALVEVAEALLMAHEVAS